MEYDMYEEEETAPQLQSDVTDKDFITSTTAWSIGESNDDDIMSSSMKSEFSPTHPTLELRTRETTVDQPMISLFTSTPSSPPPTTGVIIATSGPGSIEADKFLG